MSNALRGARGTVGRVGLFDKERPLVRLAPPDCHELQKVEYGESAFAVDNTNVPLAERMAVAVNGERPRAYGHGLDQLHTYVEPGCRKTFRLSWAASEGFCTAFRENLLALPQAGVRSLSEMMMRPEA